MNQNVFGVILFSVIVGTAIFVSAFFAVVPAPPTVVEKPVVVEKPYSSSCRKKVVNQTTPVGVANIRVVQAVLNQQTNQLSTEYSIKRESDSMNTIGVALHFFAKDGGKTRYLATETMTVFPNFDDNGKATLEMSPKYSWLNSLKRRDNLYVIADSSLNYNRSHDLEPNFDQTKATAVLLNKGE